MSNRKLFLNEFRVLRAIFARKKEWRRPLLVFPFSLIFNKINLQGVLRKRLDLLPVDKVDKIPPYDSFQICTPPDTVL